MKKFLIILSISLLLVGCGTKKNKTTKTDDNTEDNISLTLGESDMTFKEDNISCGNHNVQSQVTFKSDGTANYEFYDCQDGNVILETSEGTYSTNDLDITLKNSYEENLTFEITGNNEIQLKDGNKTVRVFTN